METILHMEPKDNLVTCLRDVKQGETILFHGVPILVNGDIPQFHKMAVADIAKGEACYKYGEIIGLATAHIRAGDYVHVHNCESTRGRGDRQ